MAQRYQKPAVNSSSPPAVTFFVLPTAAAGRAAAGAACSALFAPASTNQFCPQSVRRSLFMTRGPHRVVSAFLLAWQVIQSVNAKQSA